MNNADNAIKVVSAEIRYTMITGNLFCPHELPLYAHSLELNKILPKGKELKPVSSQAKYGCSGCILWGDPDTNDPSAVVEIAVNTSKGRLFKAVGIYLNKERQKFNRYKPALNYYTRAPFFNFHADSTIRYNIWGCQ